MSCFIMNYHRDDVTKYLSITGKINNNFNYYILIMGEIQFNYSITTTNPTINATFEILCMIIYYMYYLLLMNDLCFTTSIPLYEYYFYK